MAQPKNKPRTKRAGRREEDVIRVSNVGQEARKKLRLPRLPRISASYVNATLGNKSGFATYSLERGDATYRAVTWAIKSSAPIPSVTTVIAGSNYVTVDHISDYLDEVRMVANGSIMQSLSMAELVKRNAFHGISYGPVYSGFAYPGEGIYQNQQVMDAYALGTMGMKSLNLELKLKDAFDANTMEVVVMPFVVDMPKWPGFVTTTERLNNTFSGAGLHTYWDLPLGDDIKDIWIQGDGIYRIIFEVDGDVMFDMDRAAYEAFLIEKGRDPSVMGDDWYIDFHAEGEARSLAALDRPAERRRDARIKLTLQTSRVSTPVEFLVTHADLYSKIR